MKLVRDSANELYGLCNSVIFICDLLFMWVSISLYNYLMSDKVPDKRFPNNRFHRLQHKVSISHMYIHNDELKPIAQTK